MRFDAQAVYFRGQLSQLALIFTRSGRGRALTAACIIAIAAYALLRLPLWIPLVMSLSQMVSQVVVECFKALFKRMRPDYWLVGLDAGHSYPSGHATTAVVFFLGWALVVALSDITGTLKLAIVVLLAAWAIGICWSRLALGAHYLSDVAGGLLFGAGWLCAAFAISAHFYEILRLRG